MESFEDDGNRPTEDELRARCSSWRDGDRSSEDLARAAEMCRSAASEGHTWAAMELFDILWAAGDPGRYAEMVDIIRPVAEAGVPRALARLGRMYSRGMGVDRDINIAILALNQAAREGVDWCRADLVLLRAERGTAEDKEYVLAECVNLGDKELAKCAIDVLLRGSSDCDLDTAMEIYRRMGFHEGDDGLASLLALCNTSSSYGEIGKFEFPGATYRAWQDDCAEIKLGAFLGGLSEENASRPSFTIFGSCVPRDALAISGLEEYCKVDAYYSFVSPLVFGFEPVKRPEAEDSDKWMARCHALDLDKELSRRLEFKKSDYLIIDLADIRYNLNVYEGGGTRTAVTGSRLDSMYEGMMEGMFPSGHVSTLFPSTMSRADIERMMEPFIESVRNVYECDRVILIVSARAGTYKGRDGNVKRFDMGNAAVNWLIRVSSRILVERLNLSKVVSVPESVVADESHKWGLDKLHYTEDMYRYIGESIMGFVKEDREHVQPARPHSEAFSGKGPNRLCQPRRAIAD